MGNIVFCSQKLHDIFLIRSTFTFHILDWIKLSGYWILKISHDRGSLTPIPWGNNHVHTITVWKFMSARECTILSFVACIYIYHYQEKNRKENMFWNAFILYKQRLYKGWHHNSSCNHYSLPRILHIVYHDTYNTTWTEFLVHKYCPGRNPPQTKCNKSNDMKIRQLK